MPVSAEEARYNTVSIIFIERDEIVPIPMRAITMLCSYALAGPSNDASRQSRDDALEKVKDAIMAHFDAVTLKVGHVDNG